jgi:phosphoglycolate phosphatase
VVKLPQCVLFDLDGTLLNSIPGIAYSVAAAFRAAGLPERTLDLRRLIGPPIRTILSRAAEATDDALLDELEWHFRVSYDSEGWGQTLCFPGVPELLETLKRNGHRLFIISNKPRHISIRTATAHRSRPTAACRIRPMSGSRPFTRPRPCVALRERIA